MEESGSNNERSSVYYLSNQPIESPVSDYFSGILWRVQKSKITSRD